MASLFLDALTGEQALRQRSEALVVRLQPVYEVDGEYCRVNAKADWSSANLMEFTVAGENSTALYRVTGLAGLFAKGNIYIQIQWRLARRHFHKDLHVNLVDALPGTWPIGLALSPSRLCAASSRGITLPTSSAAARGTRRTMRL